MIVTCQNCNARFNLKDSLVKPRGSKVRCSKCQYIFVVYPEAPPKPAAPGKTAPMGDTAAGPPADQGPDLSEIEKMLESSEGQGLDFGEGATGSDAESRESPASKSGADGVSRGPDTSGGILDLSEIEKMLDLDQELDFDGESTESEPDDLIFDLEEPMAEEADDKENLGDFDLADIEKMLEQDLQETETEAPTEAPSDSGDIDLSDLDELLKTTPETAAPEPTLEQPGAQASDELSLASESDEDLDLSALDEMMETESPAEPDSLPQPEVGDLKLEFEDEETAQGPATTEAAPSESADELDFSGLEAMMEAEGGGSAPDAADEVASASTPADVEAAGEEMDLEFEMEEPESPPAGEDSEDDFQISIGEAAAESAGAEAAGETSESDELSLEFDDEPIEHEQTDEATPEEKEAAMSSPVDEPSSKDREAEEVAEEAIEEDADAQYDAVSAEQVPAGAEGSDKRQRAYMIALLVLILVIAGLGGGLFYMRQAGIQIPFLAGLQKPQVPDQGNLKITTIDIDSRRVENASAGHLFVISGKVRNGYKDARSFIKITGKLYSKGKKLFSTETVYCGNIMSDIELAKLPLETIKSRMGNEKGDNGADIGIKPGQERPFMIVFSNLPANLEELEEYTLEVASSKPAGPADGHP
jgi:pilus assembly protein FimV